MASDTPKRTRYIASLRMLVLCVFIIAIWVAPTAAQEAGAIIEGNPNGADNMGPLNPLVCDEYYCLRINALLYPMLLAVDPQAGEFRGALTEDNALVESWELSDDGTLNLTLRDDLHWSDGEPITAEDVVFTLTAIASDDFGSPHSTDGIATFDAIDDQHLSITFTAPGCDALDLAQFPIVPAHVFDRADAAETGYGYLGQMAATTEPAVTAGEFSFRKRQSTDYVRLDAAPNIPGLSGYEFRDVGNELDAFLNGDVNFMIDIPYTWYADLYQRVPSGEIQLAEFPGLRWDTVIYNLADPSQPESAFDEDNDPVAQIPHPVLSDLAVRQAIQLALDVPALIEAGSEGHSTQMASSVIPASWAFDPDLAPIETNIVAARQLLEDAGWKDTNGNDVLECINCASTYRGAELYLEMVYADSARNSEMANLISQQLRRVGIYVDYYSLDFGSLLSQLESQQFSMALVNYVENWPVDANQYQYSIAEDRVYGGSNYGSYHNVNVDRLLEQARTLPGCDPDERQRLYAEIQRELQADPPAAWLMVRHEMVAAGTEIRNFAPVPGDPFWNVREWDITG